MKVINVLSCALGLAFLASTGCSLGSQHPLFFEHPNVSEYRGEPLNIEDSDAGVVLQTLNVGKMKEGWSTVLFLDYNLDGSWGNSSLSIALLDAEGVVWQIGNISQVSSVIAQVDSPEAALMLARLDSTQLASTFNHGYPTLVEWPVPVFPSSPMHLTSWVSSEAYPFLCPYSKTEVTQAGDWFVIRRTLLTLGSTGGVEEVGRWEDLVHKNGAVFRRPLKSLTSTRVDQYGMTLVQSIHLRFQWIEPNEK